MTPCRRSIGSGSVNLILGRLFSSYEEDLCRDPSATAPSRSAAERSNPILEPGSLVEAFLLPRRAALTGPGPPHAFGLIFFISGFRTRT
jgi:hypothetical protein